jgi:D-alanyl-D-alanine carboxypeptidase (penicillin-binding protein 5/6)
MKLHLIIKTVLLTCLLAGVMSAAVTPPVLAARSRSHHHLEPGEGTGEESGAVAAAPPAVALNQIHVLGNRPAPFALDARSAMLVDGRSGAMLYAFNEHQKIEPASLTKIMTFYITLRALHDGRLKLDTPIPISEKAWRLSMDPSVSRMFLGVGQTVPVKELLYGLMVSSGNDAAVALAEYQAGSTDAFTIEMNKTAGELGLAETHFTNPDGLPSPDEYTTAADMVHLAHALITTYPDALDITATKEFTFDKIEQRNFNTLLFYDARVNGLKTGHVDVAGYHLVATASSNGLELISAVMGTTSPEKRRTETEKLLDWAFRTYVTARPDWSRATPDHLRVYQGEQDSVAIAPQSPVCLTVARGDDAKIVVVSMIQSKYLVAPIASGQPVGQLTLMLNGAPQVTIPIVTQSAVAEGGFLKRMTDRVREVL